MKTILTFFCFLLLVCPGFAKDKQPGDVKLTELLKKIDSQAMPDSYVGKNHQKWVDTRMAKLTEAQKALHGRLWEARRKLAPKKADVGQSFIKILH